MQGYFKIMTKMVLAEVILYIFERSVITLHAKGKRYQTDIENTK